MADTAGASARRQYHRRRRRERGIRIALLLIVVCLANRFGAPVLVLALPLVVRRRAPSTAWRVGAEGEEATAVDLAPLARRGFAAFHDRTLPGSRANVDHVVIGPTGVFTIETKNYGGEVTLRRSLLRWRVVARHNGRRLDSVVDQAIHQADVVSTLLADKDVVAPIIVIRRADLVVGWFARAVTDGVRWCAPTGAVRFIERRPAQLSADAVTRIVGALDRGLSEITCVCGADLVLRHRGSDDAPFFGCSTYPACHHTRAITR